MIMLALLGAFLFGGLLRALSLAPPALDAPGWLSKPRAIVATEKFGIAGVVAMLLCAFIETVYITAR